jgi:hypothetical protein
MASFSAAPVAGRRIAFRKAQEIAYPRGITMEGHIRLAAGKPQMTGSQRSGPGRQVSPSIRISLLVFCVQSNIQLVQLTLLLTLPYMPNHDIDVSAARRNSASGRLRPISLTGPDGVAGKQCTISGANHDYDKQPIPMEGGDKFWLGAHTCCAPCGYCGRWPEF